MRLSQKSVSLAVLLLLTTGIAGGLLLLQALYLPGNLPLVGQPLPALTFTDLEGRQVGFDRYLGRKLLAVFVDPECGFCQDQYQVLREFHQGAGSYNLAVVVVARKNPGAYVAVDGPTPLPLPFAVWLDADRQLRGKLGTMGVPALFLLDEHGILRSRQVGYQTLDGIVALIRDLDRPRPANAHL